MRCAQALGSMVVASVGNSVFRSGYHLDEEKLDQVDLAYLVSSSSKQI